MNFLWYFFIFIYIINLNINLFLETQNFRYIWKIIINGILLSHVLCT